MPKNTHFQEMEVEQSDSEMDVDLPTKSTGAKKKPFLELTDRHKRNKLKDLKSDLKDFCTEEKVDMFTLLGIIGKDIFLERSDLYDFKIGTFFKEIAEGKDVLEKRFLTPEQGLFIQEYLQLGKMKYSNLKQFLDQFVHLPGITQVRKLRKSLLPKVERFETSPTANQAQLANSAKLANTAESANLDQTAN